MSKQKEVTPLSILEGEIVVCANCHKVVSKALDAQGYHMCTPKKQLWGKKKEETKEEKKKGGNDKKQNAEGGKKVTFPSFQQALEILSKSSPEYCAFCGLELELEDNQVQICSSCEGGL